MLSKQHNIFEIIIMVLSQVQIAVLFGLLVCAVVGVSSAQSQEGNRNGDVTGMFDVW